jgi:dipeptidyl aminopeptidase/acylaminoacyl peptidase
MKTRHATFLSFVLLAAPLLASSDDAAPRLLRPDDIFALKTLNDPQVSPEGSWVAFTVRTIDAKEDRRDTDVWMVPLAATTAGGGAVRVTSSPKPESRPRFSPDGRYLAFLSGREGEHSQVWLLDRQGGEAVKLTDYKSDVSDLAWSPDGKRLALIVGDVDPDDPNAPGTDGKPKEGAAKTPKPIVIHRLQFKRDREGYLRELRSHLYVFDVATKKSEQITSGPYDDEEPAWSPDGRWVAFSSNRTKEPDANDNRDVFLIAPRAGETPKALTTSPASDSSPSFSPDGRWITYVTGGAPEDIWYATSAVAVVPVEGGEPRVLTRALDRNVYEPRFTPDGRSILFRVDEEGTVHLARVPAAGGATDRIERVERVVGGDRQVESYSQGPKGELVVLESQPSYPAEISAVEAKGTLRRLTRMNDDFLKGIRLAKVERLKVKSADGQEIDAFLTLPPDAAAGPGGRRLPTILRIHGGPTDQYTMSFQPEWQILAAHGYAVVAANPRGSSGYGRDFSHALWADWGNKDYDDVMAAVDRVIAMGIADPDRLGVGGWSYGGILTDYVVTKTGRFKAAISGSSETNYLANYGTDHYQREWEAELGLPWKNPQLWIRLSPFFQVEKITTPTLFLCGSADVNVPCLNSEQLFQAMRRLGRDTELVVYPDQFHSIEKPSYVKDRFERYLDWYDKHLLSQSAAR